MLSIELVREIPEQLKPRRIELATPAVTLASQGVEPKLANEKLGERRAA
jgi:hypothetical protein